MLSDVELRRDTLFNGFEGEEEQPFQFNRLENLYALGLRL